MRTTQVYEVIDAMSEVLLGYCISDTEDYEAQYHAYRMAIQKSGHKPYEIVYDNQGGHKKLDSTVLSGRFAAYTDPTQPYNGESKTIESVFGRFQAQVLHKDWRFTGQNVTAKKASSRPNVEFIEANKDSLYTLEELKDAYAAARKEWNEGVHPATGERRIDMYEKSVNEETQEVTLHDMVDMFLGVYERMATFTDQGLQVTVKWREAAVRSVLIARRTRPRVAEGSTPTSVSSWLTTLTTLQASDSIQKVQTARCASSGRQNHTY